MSPGNVKGLLKITKQTQSKNSHLLPHHNSPTLWHRMDKRGKNNTSLKEIKKHLVSSQVDSPWGLLWCCLGHKDSNSPFCRTEPPAQTAPDTENPALHPSPPKGWHCNFTVRLIQETKPSGTKQQPWGDAGWQWDSPCSYYLLSR